MRERNRGHRLESSGALFSEAKSMLAFEAFIRVYPCSSVVKHPPSRQTRLSMPVSSEPPEVPPAGLGDTPRIFWSTHVPARPVVLETPRSTRQEVSRSDTAIRKTPMYLRSP